MSLSAYPRLALLRPTLPAIAAIAQPKPLVWSGIINEFRPSNGRKKHITFQLRIMDWGPFVKKDGGWLYGINYSFLLKLDCFFAYISKTKCDRSKRISNSERVSKNISIKRKKGTFLNVHLYALMPTSACSFLSSFQCIHYLYLNSFVSFGYSIDICY